MQQGSGIILILAGFLVIYIVVTGKYPVFEEFFYKLFNLTPNANAKTTSVNPGQVSSVANQAKVIADAVDTARKAAQISGGASEQIVIH